MEEALARLKPLLESPAVLKVAQNGKYDLAVLARHGIDVGPMDDTMLIAFALEGGLHKSYGMDELSKRLLDHEPISFKTVAGTGKGQKSFKHVELGPATCYAAEDADVTLRGSNDLAGFDAAAALDQFAVQAGLLVEADAVGDEV